MITDLRQINLTTPEGKLLMAALAVITTECRTHQDPYEVLVDLEKLAVSCFDYPKNETLVNKILQRI